MLKAYINKFVYRMAAQQQLSHVFVTVLLLCLLLLHDVHLFTFFGQFQTGVQACLAWHPLKAEDNLNSTVSSVPTSKKTPHHKYKGQLVKMFRDIFAVYFENQTKLTNTALVKCTVTEH